MNPSVWSPFVVNSWRNKIVHFWNVLRYSLWDFSLLVLTDLSFTLLAFSLHSSIHMHKVIPVGWSKMGKANALAPFPSFYIISGGKVAMHSPWRGCVAATEHLNHILIPKLLRTPTLPYGVYGAMNPYGFKVKQKSWFMFLNLQIFCHFWASSDFAYLSIKWIMAGISCHQVMLCG